MEKFEYIKIARKSIYYWKIIKCNTDNYLNPIKLKLKLKMYPVLCPYCKDIWSQYDNILKLCLVFQEIKMKYECDLRIEINSLE